MKAEVKKIMQRNLYLHVSFEAHGRSSHEVNKAITQTVNYWAGQGWKVHTFGRNPYLVGQFDVLLEQKNEE